MDWSDYNVQGHRSQANLRERKRRAKANRKLAMLRLGGAKQTATSSPMMRPSFYPSSRILLHASIFLQSLQLLPTIQGNEGITKEK